VTAPNARVLLLTLSERTSARTGRRYMSGWLGKASVVAFEAGEPDRYGNAQWEVFVSTPEPRDGGKAPGSAPAGGREGWNGSPRYRQPRPGAPAAPPAGHAPFDDGLEDIGRGSPP
jgi:hypothetical protein